MSDDQLSPRSFPLLQRRHALGLGAAAAAGVAFPRAGHSQPHWSPTAGLANDIAISANGVRVVVGAGPLQGGGWPVYRQSGGAWLSVGGTGVRVAAELEGNIWLVNSAFQIFYGTFNGTAYSYQQMPGLARDIGVGWDGTTGSVWAVGSVNVGGGGGAIYRWSGTQWIGISGSASRIAVDTKGNPWVTTSGSEIWMYNQTTGVWTQVPGAANDVGVGGNGAVWVVGAGPIGNGGWPVYENALGDPVNPGWVNTLGLGTNVSVDKVGSAWVTASNNKIYRWNPV